MVMRRATVLEGSSILPASTKKWKRPIGLVGRSHSLGRPESHPIKTFDAGRERSLLWRSVWTGLTTPGFLRRVELSS